MPDPALVLQRVFDRRLDRVGPPPAARLYDQMGIVCIFVLLHPPKVEVKCAGCAIRLDAAQFVVPKAAVHAGSMACSQRCPIHPRSSVNARAGVIPATS